MQTLLSLCFRPRSLCGMLQAAVSFQRRFSADSLSEEFLKYQNFHHKNLFSISDSEKRLYSKTKKHCSESYVKQAFQRCFAQFYCQRWDYTISLHILQQYKAKGTGKKPFYLPPLVLNAIKYRILVLFCQVPLTVNSSKRYRILL